MKRFLYNPQVDAKNQEKNVLSCLQPSWWHIISVVLNCCPSLSILQCLQSQKTKKIPQAVTVGVSSTKWSHGYLSVFVNFHDAFSIQKHILYALPEMILTATL